MMGLVGSLGNDFRAVQLANNTVCIGSVFLGSILLRAVILSREWNALAIDRLIPRLLCIIFTLGLIHAAGFRVLYHFFPTFYDARPGTVALLMSFCICAMLLLTWSALYLGYQTHQRLQQIQLDKIRAEAAQREAELRALRTQVDPHFLFNSLNTIRHLIRQDTEAAREAVTDLSRLFRRSLQTGTALLIPLRDELETVEAYLTLEAKRFEDRLRVRKEIDELSLEFPIPPFLLQTLIENALKHGISKRVEGGELCYRTKLERDRLLLSVSNPGHLEGSCDENSRGLINARERLKLLFGDAVQLQLRQENPNLVVAEVALCKS
jgi:LytS/YehU family sensor histidine kinase